MVYTHMRFSGMVYTPEVLRHGIDAAGHVDWHEAPAQEYYVVNGLNKHNIIKICSIYPLLYLKQSLFNTNMLSQV